MSDGASNMFFGRMDEVRFTKSELSADYVSAAYASQDRNNEGQFTQYGSEGQIASASSFDTITLSVTNPLFAGTCGAGQVMIGVFSNGTIQCSKTSHQTVAFMQTTGHNVADGQFWAFGVSTDSSSCKARQNLIPFDMTIDTIILEPRSWTVTGNTTFMLTIDETPTDVRISINQTVPNNVPIINTTGSVDLSTGDQICFLLDFNGGTGTGNLRSFSISGYGR